MANSKLVDVAEEKFLALATDMILLEPIINEYKKSFNLDFGELGNFDLEKKSADKVFHEAGRIIFNQQMRLN